METMIRRNHSRRPVRRDQGTVLLTERDRQVLAWIAEQDAVRFDDVHALLGQQAGPGARATGCISEGAARQVVARWQKAGWAAARKMLVHEPAWVWVTERGLHELGYPFTPDAPTVARADRLHAINRVRLSIARDHPDWRWISARRLRAERGAANRAGSSHIPDGALRTPQGTTIALVVAEASDSPTDVYLILRDLLPHYHALWYIASDFAAMTASRACQELEPALAGRVKIVRPE